MLDEPTRGIDIGAKFEIYTLIHELAQQGKAVILVSPEMEELIGLCNRIYIMYEGRSWTWSKAKERHRKSLSTVC